MITKVLPKKVISLFLARGHENDFYDSFTIVISIFVNHFEDRICRKSFSHSTLRLKVVSYFNFWNTLCCFLFSFMFTVSISPCHHCLIDHACMQKGKCMAIPRVCVLIYILLPCFFIYSIGILCGTCGHSSSLRP